MLILLMLTVAAWTK